MSIGSFCPLSSRADVRNDLFLCLEYIHTSVAGVAEETVVEHEV
jgi:hypothetical protein